MLGNIIKKYREEMGYTQNQLAQMLEMSRTGFASWEQNLSEPNSSDIKKLCVIFDVSADELLEIDTEEKRKEILKSLRAER